MLRYGSRGSAVEQLQSFLIDAGYDLGSAGADGIFGSKTRAAVRAFQADNGLTVDGIVGPNTQGAIDSYGTLPSSEPDEPDNSSEPDEDTGFEDDDTVQPEGSSTPAGSEDVGLPGIMAGGTIHRVNNPDQDDYYIVAYEYPPGSGHAFYYQFGSPAALEAAIGPNLGGGSVTIGSPLSEATVRQWTNGGDASEIVGVSGSFNAYLDDTIQEAALQGGIGDPTVLGQAMSDPDMQLILAQAAEGQWTPERVKAAMRDTDFYKNVLYPGIEHLYNVSPDPEQDYASYSRNVVSAAKDLGLQRDADGSYKSVVADLLSAGVSDAAFSNFAPVYRRAQTNVSYADALSKWTEQFAGVTINSFEDWYDVLAGEAPAQINEIAEVAGLQYVADNAGFAVSDSELAAISQAVDVTEAEASRLFSSTARSLIALGERGLSRAGLTSRDILEAEAGFSSSGKNIEKIRQKAQKYAVEEGLVDDDKAQFFLGFTRDGKPERTGLAALAPESG